MSDDICLSLEEIQQLKSIEPLDHQHCSLSSYIIQGPIGKGQFSTVYRACSKVNGRNLALKKISLWSMVDSKSRQDCVKEAHLLPKLNHPHIIEYIAAFIEGSELNIALELADAGDLSLLIKGFAKLGFLIPEKTTWRILLQISSAINHMHSKKIMHRDIKPANVFLTLKGDVKLGDLGIARYFSPETSIAHSFLGTPYYMSPERIQGHGYDFKSDIWSIGCLIYEMTALQPPFHSREKNLMLICQRIATVDYPPIPSDLYSDELRSLTQVCLDKEMKKRPDSEQLHAIAQEMWHKFNKAPSYS
ncbi:serine/threonine-protein kinase Nek6-like [Ischnura elegans]|uniref:serine/threonine-protein kinase Nek6-like n=1 Tax=Ischnura elegans TaxID=197161 RepID=UPI001ED8999B|nr:serine/threonine-protein kinase Nek6-like [Ischnura elegans]XP_046405748.1 serine/threonine-protein kinase Nek6-like [Ischnura elegans]XP_046405749.1 serine/threonine-protein kinase Nek6-like [Ischnura elegans]